ncbi:MAG: 30S ribosomal protein S6 [Deltaproteobacteria bacterium]|nr:MAG: 30S ribosomal protein S6 [Deltaproteobacteria bacterium]
MIRHEYETIYVTRPDLADADQTRIDEKLQGIIAAGNGELLVFESWGRRKLAYPIRRHQQGTYQYLHYVGPSDLPGQLERSMRLEDALIRFLTVKLDEDVDIEAVRQAAAAEQERRSDRLGLIAEENEEDEEDVDSDSADDNTADETVGDGDDDTAADSTEN